MNPTNTQPLFHTWPLAALALCAAGLVVRAVVARDDAHAARLALHRARRWFRGGRLLTVGLVLLLAGHLAGMLFPRAILAWNHAPARLYLLEGAAFAVGLAALAAWLRATWRHLRRADAPLAVEMGDSLFLAMVFLAIASGLGMAAVHRWSSSWGIVTLRPYVLSILAGDPQSALVDRLPFLTRAHLFATFAALAVFPLTRLAPVPILLVLRAGSVCARPVVWVSRTGGLALWNRCVALLWNEPQVRWPVKPASPAEAVEAAFVAARRGNRPFRPHLANALVGEGAVFSRDDSAIRKART
jgi:nitrate reductase gamma subunit